MYSCAVCRPWLCCLLQGLSFVSPGKAGGPPRRGRWAAAGVRCAGPAGQSGGDGPAAPTASLGEFKRLSGSDGRKVAQLLLPQGPWPVKWVVARGMGGTKRTPRCRCSERRQPPGRGNRPPPPHLQAGTQMQGIEAEAVLEGGFAVLLERAAGTLSSEGCSGGGGLSKRPWAPVVPHLRARGRVPTQGEV